MSNTREPKIRRLQTTIIILFQFSIFNLFFSCDLFNGSSNNNLLDKIDNEIAWANAEKLTVRIDYPGEWGTSSPPAGNITPAMDIRQGYAFEIEFIPLSGYGFEQWLAFPSAAYNELDKTKSASDSEIGELSLIGNGVTISVTGARTASVTITTLVSVTLVPWCNKRPALIRSNPPIIPAISPFPYDQKITLWFNMGIDDSTLLIGETIVINAVYASGQNNGQPAGRNGDGDISDYFKVFIYDPDEWRVELAAKNDGEYPSKDLQLLNISVSAGPGIQNLNGLEMADAQTVTYLTDTSEAQKVYEAGSIKASREDGSGYFMDFGTSWQDPEIDRRFNQTTIAPYNFNIVHTTFTVTVPDGAPQQVPNRFYIYERLYANLIGLPITPTVNWLEYEYPGPKVTLSNNVYSVSHVLQTGKDDIFPLSGIMQLIVLPWNKSDVEGEGYQPQDMEAAVAAGQYVTIVMDNEAPGIGDLGVEIAGGAYDSDSKLYNFASGSDFTLTMNRLAMLADNWGQGGILASEVWNKPWTMDDRKNLQWRLTVPDTAIDSDWRPVEENGVLKNVFGPENLSGLSGNRRYTVEIEFRDRMGNVSKTTAAAIQIVAGMPLPVTGLNAVCNTAGNQITVEWNTPADGDGKPQNAELWINGRREEIFTGTGDNKEYSFSVTPINADRVRDGESVSGVTRYDISVIAYNATGAAEARELSIWNIPDMSNSTDDPLIEVSSSGQWSVSGNQLGSNFVLTNDITLTNHTPIGPFTGKFYGNGHTVTINSISAGANYVGLFGQVSGANAEIRDLRVVYNSPAISGGQYFGGISGSASSVLIQNVIVEGTVNKLILSANTDNRAGGIVGMMNGGTIRNSISNLNIIVTNSGTAKLWIGGVCGDSSGSAVFWECIFKDGSIDVGATATVGEQHIGGFVGYATNTRFEKCGSQSGMIIGAFTSSNDNVNCGGFIGRVGNGLNFNSCFSASSLDIQFTGTVSNAFCGGFVGRMADDATISGCYATGSVFFKGNVTGPINNGGLVAGGFLGLAGQRNEFEDCYALGNVVAENTGSIGTRVGGFAGDIRNPSSSINRCFSAGSVSGAAPTGEIYVGGILGIIYSNGSTGRINGCVAMGDSLTAKGSGAQYVNRIYYTVSPTRAGNNNHAKSTMGIEKGDYDASFITPVYADDLPSPNYVGHANFNGISTSASTFRNPSFWRYTLKFNFDEETGKETEIWNLSAATARGYPTLKDVGGQQ